VTYPVATGMVLMVGCDIGVMDAQSMLEKEELKFDGN
jgi:hypothetical protein